MIKPQGYGKRGLKLWSSGAPCIVLMIQHFGAAEIRLPNQWFALLGISALRSYASMAPLMLCFAMVLTLCRELTVRLHRAALHAGDAVDCGSFRLSGIRLNTLGLHGCHVISQLCLFLAVVMPV